MKDHFKKLARYNRWANQKLYDACAELSTEDYLKDRHAFFSSIHGTLNHILVADTLWLGRFKQVDSGIFRLDQILYSDLNSLYQARQKEDLNIIEFIDEFNPDKLSEILSFTSLSGRPTSMSFNNLFSHLFNHQTHHRGQVHNMLSQAGLTPPQLDLYYFLME